MLHVETKCLEESFKKPAKTSSYLGKLPQSGIGVRMNFARRDQLMKKYTQIRLIEQKKRDLCLKNIIKHVDILINKRSREVIGSVVDFTYWKETF